MASSMGTSKTMFTVEQVELIRRLRNSGITKEQIILAFESFERIDEELGMIYTIPQAMVAGHSKSSVYTCQTTAASSTMDVAESHRKRRRLESRDIDDTVTSENSNLQPDDPPELETESKLETFDRLSSSHHRSEKTSPATSGAIEPFLPGFLQSGGRVNDELTRQMYSWYLHQQGMTAAMLQSHASQVSDIMRRPVLPTPKDKTHEQLSHMTNLNIKNVRTDISEPGEKSIQNIHKYESLRNNLILKMREMKAANEARHESEPTPQAAPLTSPSHSPSTGSGGGFACPSNSHAYPDDEPRVVFMHPNQMDLKREEFLDCHFSPRRERFTFREKHLEILESCFKVNQYPAHDERELIASKCNSAMTITSGRVLDEKEKVTNQNVQNWFNNRRKEIKKLARAVGIDCSEVALPSRLKPRSPYVDTFYVMDNDIHSDNGLYPEMNANIDDHHSAEDPETNMAASAAIEDTVALPYAGLQTNPPEDYRQQSIIKSATPIRITQKIKQEVVENNDVDSSC